MKWSVSRGIALTLATLFTVCGGWLLLAPTAIGGPVSLVMTSGISMQPRFHTGDLAVLHKSSTYHVGDIVGYHSHTLRGAVVMHRLVAGDGSGWTTKGDHNTWLDPDHPTGADIVGKLWVHVPKGGILLTRVFLPLALVGVIGLLLPFGKRRNHDEDDEVPAPSMSPTRRQAARGRHAGRRKPSPRPAARVPDWLTSQLCARLVAGGLTVAIVGTLVAVVGYARPLHRTTTVSRSSQTTVKFGWTGVSDNTLIYPGGKVTDPMPIFPKVIDQITLTADVAAKDHPLDTPRLTATLSDSSGWTHDWPLDTTADRIGNRLRLSGTVNLSLLLVQVSMVQATTGVSSPATLQLHVAANGESPNSGPSLSFALSNVTLKPQGSLTVTRSGSTTTRASVPATLTVSGHDVRISRLRQAGAVAVALGLLVALAAVLLNRRAQTPTATDRLLRLFAGRVVHLTGTEPWDNSLVDVTDPDSLAAFATAPTAVLYVVDAGEHQVLIAERGGTRLRYVRSWTAEAGAAEPDQLIAQEKSASWADIPHQRPWAAEDGADVDGEVPQTR